MTESINASRQYGTWPSPLTAAMVTSSSAALGAPNEYQGLVFATESRPAEAGRVALVRCDETGATHDALPSDYSVRTRVHEYGGRAWWSGSKGVYFCHWADQRLYLSSGDAKHLTTPIPLTPEPLTEHGLRFADGVETPDGQWVIAVAEIHGEDRTRFNTPIVAEHEPSNVVVAIPTDGSAVNEAGAMHVLVNGPDFVSNPRVSADGQHLCWVHWQHPNMPWDETHLCAATMVTSTESGVRVALENVAPIAGGNHTSIVGPQWLRNGRLAFSTDASGWWNLHAVDVATRETEVLTTLNHAEIGAPAWGIGTTRFVELSSASDNDKTPWLALAVTDRAEDHVALLLNDGSLVALAYDCAAVRALSSTTDGGLLCLVELKDAQSGHVRFSTNELLKLACGTQDKTQANARKRSAPAAVISANNSATEFECAIAQAIEFPSAGETAHAFFYAPTSKLCKPPENELPPLIVMGHGGPTAHATPALRLSIQFWTSRGFAVADVNYRGSSGFGRAYRQGLNEAWGVADVEDCIQVATHLAHTGRVDANRCVIRGGSAGGLTVLRALQLSDVFAAGTSLYGVADLEGLLAETHKFESRYLDNLIGAYPEQKDRYQERSPVNHASDIHVPLLVLQGDEDKVVPPSQSERIVAAVAKQGLPHAYVLFTGEQHGWRQSSTMIRALELELWFYGKTLGFSPADDIAAPTEAQGF